MHLMVHSCEVLNSKRITKADKMKFTSAIIESLSDDKQNLLLFNGDKMVYAVTMNNKEINEFKTKYNKVLIVTQ